MPFRSLLAAVAGTLLCLTLASPAPAATPGSAPGASGDDHRSTTGAAAASTALARARALFDERAGGPHEATLVLRDLAIHKNALGGTEAKQAESLLSRPTDGARDPFGDGYGRRTDPRRSCGTYVCIHWVETSSDRVPLKNRNGNRYPDYVDKVRTTVNGLHKTYVNAGYRAPKPDRGRGGNNKPDVYLADIGDQGVYGYCATDQPTMAAPWDVWAYCVMDNDYARDEFPTNTPVQNMRVTAAHEYFHAVQFAYDFGEDGWFMEATATWAEDELVDGVNDNRSYLRSGQLGRPWVPLDEFLDLNVYGNWIFFRYLTEQFPASAAGMPTLVRSMWRSAGPRAGAPDVYSLEAVASALQEENTSLAEMYAAFADANRRPSESYEEGAAYSASPVWKDVVLTPTSLESGWHQVTLDHLTSATARFRPGAALTDPSLQLSVDIDMAPSLQGSQAVVAVTTDNTTQVQSVTLDAQGNGAARVPAFATVDHVEVTLANASARFSECWTGKRFSCQGTPTDDGRVQRVQATVVAR